MLTGHSKKISLYRQDGSSEITRIEICFTSSRHKLVLPDNDLQRFQILLPYFILLV